MHPILAEKIHAVSFTDHHPPRPGFALICPGLRRPNAWFRPAFIA